MYTDRISDMIAHFIGMFETMTDEARLRAHYTEGRDRGDMTPVRPAGEVISADQSYDITLRDYDPGVKYHAGYHDINYSRPLFGHTFDHSINRLSEIASEDFSAPYFRPHSGRGGFDQEPELVLHTGPGSLIAHVSQVNLLQDDDYLDMTDGPYKPLDTTFVTERTTEYYNEAAEFTPFSSFHRTDNYGELQSLAKTVHDYVDNAHDNDITSLGTGADEDFVKADSAISGTYINGVAVLENPDVNDFMPDRGAATPDKEPEKSDVSLEEHGPAGNSLDVAAGANVVANFVALTNTGVMSTVSAVMGDYHQIDAITQSYVYSDRDDIASVFSPSQNHMATVASNIATFERSVYGSDAGNDGADSNHASDSMIFPTAWRVSYLDGDVSFVHWIEQYHFVSDNDTMTVTTSGADVSVISGGNATLNLASFLGIGMQYDLVIVGGNVLDMSMITQIAVLYDNDWVRAADGAQHGATVQSGNNLVWNEASIHNIGSNSRFDAMPDYIHDVVKAIDERDASMPAGLSTDPNFVGQTGVNVLYITGNLYDVNLIKQVSVLGDADYVMQAASKVLSNNDNAAIHIDTGSNAVINIAHITDYDSFGTTTYLGGQLYSDAVLIQGGLIEHDTTQPHAAAAPLANEVIAFLHDDNPADDHTDGVINAGHDLSWSLAHPVDIMQTVVA
jgi:hypothetical protein